MTNGSGSHEHGMVVVVLSVVLVIIVSLHKHGTTGCSGIISTATLILELVVPEM
jgi:Flp pilus assembly pilin Flp